MYSRELHAAQEEKKGREVREGRRNNGIGKNKNRKIMWERAFEKRKNGPRILAARSNWA